MGSRDRRMHVIQILMIDMIYDDSGEYSMDPCKCNCFAEIGVDSTLNLKIIHWDLCYNIYQHPCDLMIKPFEWQPKEQWKMQCSLRKVNANNLKVPQLLLERIYYLSTTYFFNNFFFLTQWTHRNKNWLIVDKNANVLIEENAFQNAVC